MLVMTCMGMAYVVRRGAPTEKAMGAVGAAEYDNVHSSKTYAPQGEFEYVRSCDWEDIRRHAVHPGRLPFAACRVSRMPS